MNHDTAQQVIQKQAMQIANLTLQNTVLEVELEQAKNAQPDGDQEGQP